MRALERHEWHTVILALREADRVWSEQVSTLQAVDATEGERAGVQYAIDALTRMRELAHALAEEIAAADTAEDGARIDAEYRAELAEPDA